jgi:hypothetical protein
MQIIAWFVMQYRKMVLISNSKLRRIASINYENEHTCKETSNSDNLCRDEFMNNPLCKKKIQSALKHRN